MLSDKGTQGAACARPLRAADTLPVAVTVQRITPQAAPLLFLPHPRRSCDFHMVSLTSLISYKSEDTGKEFARLAKETVSSYNGR